MYTYTNQVPLLHLHLITVYYVYGSVAGLFEGHNILPYKSVRVLHFGSTSLSQHWSIHLQKSKISQVRY